MHTRNINTVPKMKKKTSIFSVLIKNIIIRKKRKKKNVNSALVQKEKVQKHMRHLRT